MTARYNLETVVFDRGNRLSAGAFLKNCLGFSGGIGIQRFYELIHDHAQEVGAELASANASRHSLVPETSSSSHIPLRAMYASVPNSRVISAMDVIDSW
ncbi:hypothetical protein [Halococcus sp. IIIV-5B]|uniref:hypothetical protein n=1 Tax=Halococcus sp. IIIV-5B TaxID=2321230 RepID=UPI0011C4A42F|nr:hypothetical protein [Halococcus sp. IIIV-5B]